MSDTSTPPPRLRRPAIAALGVLALALGALQSVVEPALPLLQRELGLGPSEGALVANTLLVTGAVLTPVAGKLGDRYGGKRVLMRLMAVVAAGGLLAGLAPDCRCCCSARSSRAPWSACCRCPSSWSASICRPGAPRRRSAWSSPCSPAAAWPACSAPG